MDKSGFVPRGQHEDMAQMVACIGLQPDQIVKHVYSAHHSPLHKRRRELPYQNFNNEETATATRLSAGALWFGQRAMECSVRTTSPDVEA